MTPWRVLPYGINYNHQLVKADEAPKTLRRIAVAEMERQIRLSPIPAFT